jgi:hypothetical protein
MRKMTTVTLFEDYQRVAVKLSGEKIN